MKIIRYIILAFFFIFTSGYIYAQDIPDDVCRVEDGNVIFKIDLRWSRELVLRMQDMFELDSLVMQGVLDGLSEIKVGDENWRTRKLSDDIVELIKPLNQTGKGLIGDTDIMLLDDSWINMVYVDGCDQANWGINQFLTDQAFSYSDSIARFILPGYTGAGQVYISGTFNNWSTQSNPMQRTSDGWITEIRLKPCRYAYKYIVDGHWMPDPGNKLSEGDTHGGSNSIVFCYNHRFNLEGYKSAKKVFVAGSFNFWNKREILMQKTDTGWQLDLYLREGTHAYKFIVDKEWINDPANKTIRPDGSGNYNSFIGIGDTMFFTLSGFRDAKNINVAGNFNAWNPGELFMTRTETGWELPYVLPPGNYEYKFIVDGKWIVDPANPYTTGSGDYINSLGALKPSYVFVLQGFELAKTVLVSGSFNGWRTDGYRMVWSEGKWMLPLFIKPGKHTYKFIVDGEWILDPDNELWEENEHGTGNSVLWIGTGSE